MKFYFLLICFLLSIPSFSQNIFFEGKIMYKHFITSKVSSIEDNDWMLSCAISDTSVIYFKNHNFRISNNFVDEYYISSEKKRYYKWKGIDTLFFNDSITKYEKVLSMDTLSQEVIVLGVKCKTLIKKTAVSSESYVYATPFLKYNYDTVCLKNEMIKPFCNINKQAFSIIEEKVNDSIVLKPDLPIRKFSNSSLYKAAQFIANDSLWPQYLQKNLKSRLGSRYITIPKGQHSAQQSVDVLFVINNIGKVAEAVVINLQDVHPKLAEEAIRVVKKSPYWKPANCMGHKIPYQFVQKITFAVEDN